ncbi:hypothetical protein GDO86_015956 [Hymenochirus boettgeri]|uniref:Uncharacterized protein n=1 Tax=Hymenochirus boettgeri TaxID=247094 RepID=A0A8T2K116_9PIPI|nr:hypothetical protein GDO86_015956 [Hymenochirus boettgeri]
MSRAVQKIFRKPAWLFYLNMMMPQRSFSIHSKPPKGKVGPFETIIGLSVFAMGLLTPAGWILLHLPEQRKH